MNKTNDNPDFNPDALRQPSPELEGWVRQEDIDFIQKLQLPEDVRRTLIEGEWKTEVTPELLSTVGFNVFSWTQRARQGESETVWAIPYEKIVYARYAAHQPDIVEVYMDKGAPRGSFRIVGDDAERFWKWYTS